MTNITEFNHQHYLETKHIVSQFEKLADIGIALSSEHNTTQLLEKILMGAISLTNADGGTIYMIRDANIEAEILHNTSLKSHAIGKDDVKIIVPLFGEDGTPNLKNVVSYSYHKDETINIPDAYNAEGFDFHGTKMFDEQKNYRSTSFLTTPLKNHQHETVGMLQLINAIHPETKNVISFDAVAQRFCKSLASQAATVLTKQQLTTDLQQLTTDLAQMFESMIMLIAKALDEKSPYNGGHCRRIPELTMMIAEAAHETKEGYLKNFTLTAEDLYELRITGILHDCGKITTPEAIVDTATKLETIFDRIHLLETRFEVLKRDAEIAMLKREIDALKAGQELPEDIL